MRLSQETRRLNMKHQYASLSSPKAKGQHRACVGETKKHLTLTPRIWAGTEPNETETCMYVLARTQRQIHGYVFTRTEGYTHTHEYKCTRTERDRYKRISLRTRTHTHTQCVCERVRVCARVCVCERKREKETDTWRTPTYTHTGLKEGHVRVP